MTTENRIKSLLAIVSVIGLLFGGYKFLQTQAINAQAPYLEKKLAWCEEAVNITAKIATSTQWPRAEVNRFWQMHWGVARLIQDKGVEKAMTDLAELVKQGPANQLGAKQLTTQTNALEKQSLMLAHACRKELSSEWSSSR